MRTISARSRVVISGGSVLPEDVARGGDMDNEPPDIPSPDRASAESEDNGFCENSENRGEADTGGTVAEGGVPPVLAMAGGTGGTVGALRVCWGGEVGAPALCIWP